MANITETKTNSKELKFPFQNFSLKTDRALQWVGGVNYGNFSDTICRMRELLDKDREEVINLLISSPGGQTGVAMSFYDLVKSIYRPRLWTVGAGDVDSSAIVLFLAGEKRFLTANTTMFIHLGGRTLDGDRRFSSSEINSMAKEDEIKDRQYATLLAKESGGILSVKEVLTMMNRNTVLTAEDAVRLGLADMII